MLSFSILVFHGHLMCPDLWPLTLYNRLLQVCIIRIWSGLIIGLIALCPLCSQNMERVYSLYQTFPEGRAAEPGIPKNPYSREMVLQPASPTHLSVCQRLRKVIQELVDTEKSYVKVCNPAAVVLLRVPALLLIVLLQQLIVLPSLLLVLFHCHCFYYHICFCYNHVLC